MSHKQLTHINILANPQGRYEAYMVEARIQDSDGYDTGLGFTGYDLPELLETLGNRVTEIICE